MSTDETLFKAHRQNQLWPSIHAAVDVFYRRRLARGGAYELIWRLIHVWESTTITLASAGAAWLREESKDSDDFRGVRERLYGMALDDTGLVVAKTGPGALDGSIDKWIEILNHFARLHRRDSQGFFGKLQAFLSPESSNEQPEDETLHIDIGNLVRSWERACDVPTQIRPARVMPMTLCGPSTHSGIALHTYHRIDELCRHVEDVTRQLFAVRPGAASPDSVLSGSFVFSGSRSFGGAFEAMPEPTQGGQPSYAVNVRKGRTPQIWEASPLSRATR